MSKIILSAETGSDITPELAAQLGVVLIPMHVSMGDQTLDDGTFPPEEVCAYYDRTGKVPTTSGSTPYDFEKIYDPLFAKHPDAQVLHLAYSAVTTCSYHSGELAVEEKSYKNNVRLVDTQHVSVGQCACVCAVAAWLEAHPEATLDEAAAAAVEICANMEMSFIPSNLDYLRAGGRVSNAVALVGNLLHLHPCIDIIDGKLIAGKKYRGHMEKVVPALMRDFTQKHDPSKDQVYFIHSPYLSEGVKQAAENTAKELGFANFTWVKTGCVITCHGGPGAFGIVASRK
ncbi:MAG: DegV family protein [Oscillospiraceae bacterium]|nr:DegV family protein [Oscillospiraceae bacterium]